MSVRNRRKFAWPELTIGMIVGAGFWFITAELAGWMWIV